MSNQEIDGMWAAYLALKDIPVEARPRVFEWLHSKLKSDDAKKQKDAEKEPQHEPT